MNTTINGSASCSVLWNPTSDKIGATVAYCLIFVVSLVVNSCIGIIVTKRKLKGNQSTFSSSSETQGRLVGARGNKSGDLFPLVPTNHGSPRIIFLLVPLTYIPFKVAFFCQKLKVGVLGKALCKVIPLLNNLEFVVSVQSLVLIAVGRFGAVVCPLRSPLVSSKRCSLFIVATWIVALASTSLDLFARSLKKDEGERLCVLKWEEAFGESLSPTDYALARYIAFLYTPIIFSILVYFLILIEH